MMLPTNPHLSHFSQNGNCKTFLSDPFLHNINQSPIDLRVLRKLSFSGIPEEPKGLRGLIWRLLLGYLPLEPSVWESSLSQQRANYSLFQEEFMVVPSTTEDDHPLSTEATSKWNIFFQDQGIWEDIDKDVRRTRNDMHFFCTPRDGSLTHQDIISGNLPRRKYKRPYITGFEEILGSFAAEYRQELIYNQNIEKHADVIARILFIYAKLNPAIMYVQGMNELLAPIYYLFVQDTVPLLTGHAEADAFYCFTYLMAHIRDTFINSLDSTELGIAGNLRALTALVEKHDKQVYKMLENLQISPYYYAMRWVLLLLSQELLMPDLFRLWDSLFSRENPYDFLHYVCLVLVLRSRDEIMQGDFATAVHSIQRPLIDSISNVIDAANNYYKKDHN